MRAGLHPESEGTASFDLITSSWARSEPAGSVFRLRPSVARGITGHASAVADLEWWRGAFAGRCSGYGDRVCAS